MASQPAETRANTTANAPANTRLARLRRRWPRHARSVALHAILMAGSLLFLFPLAWLFSTSLKPLSQTMRMPPEWWPDPILWSNFREAVTYIPFFTYARNTLIIAGLGTLGTVVSSALVAYGFARIQWRGRDLLFFVLLATMMVPFPVTMVPLYAVYRELHWVGTYRPLWVPAWLGASAFNVFLLRQFFMTIPHELSEAAYMDGCSEFGIFRRVVIPLAKPALAVVALFHFLYCWNDFMGPLLYLVDQDQFTLALGLQFFQSRQGGTPWNLLLAASTLVVTPVIVLFFFTQRTFIQGITMTGLKG